MNVNVSPQETDKHALAQKLLESARSLVPVLREREAECNAKAKVPDATIEAFTDAGFFRILQPARWGGYELAPVVYADVARILAEGCMSSAWVMAWSPCTIGRWRYLTTVPHRKCGGKTLLSG